MKGIFSNCETLISLPDISKWNTNNVTDMKGIFSNCKSLISLPDISKWNTNNLINIKNFSIIYSFYQRFNTNNDIYINYYFSNPEGMD